ncbi:MAG: VOC family protein [Nitriliruptorales bacterium]|nr:VOC family protein [Nitriliruptorales bacterium]
MLAFDHAIVLTTDVDATAAWLLEEHGLATAPGGRHEGHGTANVIVPLGPDYLELMYVADPDEARSSPIGRWALEHASDEPSVAALMLRVPAVLPYALRLDLEIAEVQRTRSDGVELAWRLAGLESAFSDDPRPVFVECLMAPEHHPGRDDAPHRVQPRGIAWAEWGMEASALGRWLGQHDLDVRPNPALAGPGRIGVATEGGVVNL